MRKEVVGFLQDALRAFKLEEAHRFLIGHKRGACQLAGQRCEWLLIVCRAEVHDLFDYARLARNPMLVRRPEALAQRDVEADFLLDRKSVV